MLNPYNGEILPVGRAFQNNFGTDTDCTSAPDGSDIPYKQ